MAALNDLEGHPSPHFDDATDSSCPCPEFAPASIGSLFWFRFQVGGRILYPEDRMEASSLEHKRVVLYSLNW